jgi:CRISPR-associated protein Cas2
MPLVVIDIDGAPAELCGVLSRRLLEVRAGVYAGNLSKRAVEQAWALVLDAKPKAALLLYPGVNELGMSMQSFGTHRYRVVDNYGVPLIETTRVPK